MPELVELLAWCVEAQVGEQAGVHRGCRVLTRPSRHSGKPVTSSTAVTGHAGGGDRRRGRAGGDDLDPGVVQARGELVQPGLVVDADQGPPDRRRSAARVLTEMVTFLPVTVQPSRTSRPTDVDEQPPLDVLDAFVQGVLVVVVAHRHGDLGHDRPGVHAVVDEVDGGAGDLDAVGEGVAGPRARRGRPGSSAGWVLTHRRGNAERNAGRACLQEARPRRPQSGRGRHASAQRRVPAGAVGVVDRGRGSADPAAGARSSPGSSPVGADGHDRGRVSRRRWRRAGPAGGCRTRRRARRGGCGARRSSSAGPCPRRSAGRGCGPTAVRRHRDPGTLRTATRSAPRARPRPRTGAPGAGPASSSRRTGTRPGA